MTKEAFLPLYLSLIRPILEYAIQAVSPNLQKDIVLTERLQKLVSGISRMSDGSNFWAYRHWFISDCALTWSWCTTFSMVG